MDRVIPLRVHCIYHMDQNSKYLEFPLFTTHFSLIFAWRINESKKNMNIKKKRNKIIKNKRKISNKIKKKFIYRKRKKKNVFSNHFIHYKKILNLLVVSLILSLSYYRIFGPLEDFCHGY